MDSSNNNTELGFSVKSERACFNLSVHTDRGNGRFSHHQIAIRAKNLNGQTAYTYEFLGKLDDAGVERLRTLLDEMESLSEPVVLKRLLSITKEHSCSEWMPLVSTEEPSQASLIPRVPRFEQFVENLDAPNLFFTATHSDGNRKYFIESDIVPWGEFLTIRVYSVGDKDETKRESGFLKALLSNGPARSSHMAYQELQAALEKYTVAFTARGVPGLVEALKQSTLEVLRYSMSSERTEEESGEEPLEICCELSCPKPQFSTHIELRIGVNAAKLSVLSSHSGAKSGLILSFQPGIGVSEFTAVQIRAMRDFFNFICFQQVPPRPQGVYDILSHVLVGERNVSPSSNDGNPFENERGDIGGRSLELLAISQSRVVSGPQNFLPPDRCKRLDRSDFVQRASLLTLTLDTLGDLLSGGSILSLQLKEHIGQQQPDLIGTMHLTNYPDGRTGVRIANGMRGSRAVILRPEATSTTTDRLRTLAQLFDAFESQVHLGCMPLLKLLQDIGDERSAPSYFRESEASGPNLPIPQDRIAIENFKLAGKVLALIGREQLPGFWSFCSHQGDGSVALAMGSSCLNDALEARFFQSRLSQLVVKCRESTADSSPWETRATFQYGNEAAASNELFELVTSIRTFFRHLITAKAVDISRSRDTAYEGLSDDVRMLGGVAV